MAGSTRGPARHERRGTPGTRGTPTARPGCGGGASCCGPSRIAPPALLGGGPGRQPSRWPWPRSARCWPPYPLDATGATHLAQRLQAALGRALVRHRRDGRRHPLPRGDRHAHLACGSGWSSPAWGRRSACRSGIAAGYLGGMGAGRRHAGDGRVPRRARPRACARDRRRPRVPASCHARRWRSSLVWWPGYVRLIEAKALTLRREPYVEASRTMGASPRLGAVRATSCPTASRC